MDWKQLMPSFSILKNFIFRIVCNNINMFVYVFFYRRIFFITFYLCFYFYDKKALYRSTIIITRRVKQWKSRNKPKKHTTSFWRLCNVHNVKTTSYGRQNNVVCVLERLSLPLQLFTRLRLCQSSLEWKRANNDFFFYPPTLMHPSNTRSMIEWFIIFFISVLFPVSVQRRVVRCAEFPPPLWSWIYVVAAGGRQRGMCV